MAATSPAHFDTEKLRREVRATYQRVADDPHGAFHFHRGADYAASMLGYDRASLEALPRISTDAFAGVGNPHKGAPVRVGETVLDHACGAGMDLLLAAVAAGPTGRAIGVDMTPGMAARARSGAELAGLRNVEVREGVYEALPLQDASVDVVLSNGVLNLAPDKRLVLGEIARVLRPGGRLLLADVVVQRELKLEARSNPDLWAACVGGALPEPELFELAAGAGLIGARLVDRYDCFRGTSAEAKVARDLKVGAIAIVAYKP